MIRFCHDSQAVMVVVMVELWINGQRFDSADAALE
jgi:hypothetical protein